MTPTTAPYRFIPIEPERVIAPPVALTDLRFDRPLAAGSVSATLSVTWTAKTPVCIGEASEAGDEIRPLAVGGRYGLPGASLSGMLRSVVEIATFSHLGRINGHRHASHRDFKGIEDGAYHAVAPSDAKAGWLRWDETRETWSLYPAKFNGNFLLVPVRNILDRLDADGTSITSDDWLNSETQAKYDRLPADWSKGTIRHLMACETVDTGENKKKGKAGLKKARIFRAKGERFEVLSVGKDYPDKDVILVCGGPAPEPPPTAQDKRKANESLFPPPSDEGYVIPQEWMEVFHRMHADPGREGGNPRGAWRAWLRGMGWTGAFKGFEAAERDTPIPAGMTRETRPQGIPVFWKGTLPNEATANEGPGRQDFWLSLSRVFRVPHEYSVGEVAQRLYTDGGPYDPPRLDQPNGWDFARALFGEVDGANRDAHEGEREVLADGTRQERALRGRIAVGFAWAPRGTRPEAQTHTGVFGQPRESFWPFYLRDRDDPGEGGSYSSANTVPAGRKRTVVRSHADSDWPSGNENNRTLSTVRFLPAGTTFTGQIRVHNLHPVEFGALLWALSFGDAAAFGPKGGGRWHQIGRAKGFGYGAISPRVSLTKGPLVRATDPEMTAASALPDWIALFTAFMDTRLGGRPGTYLDDPAIRALVAGATPATGDRMVGRLKTGELDHYTAWREQFKKGLSGQQTIRYPLDGP